MQAKVKKVIQQKQSNLDRLISVSGRIVDEAFSYVRSLEGVNAEIEAEKAEINELKLHLTETEIGLEDVQLRNSKLISNFKKLFEV